MRRIRTYVLLICQFAWMPASSQFLHNYGEQIISIEKDAIFTVRGEVLNDGMIINMGTLSVSGHWDNTNIYHGNGAIVLNGEETQEFDNNGQDVFKLSIDGGGEKLLKANLKVNKELSLLNGWLTPFENIILLLTDSATVTEASSEAYVNGAMRYAGTGYKFFPVGRNGNYRPLELLDITGINPVISVEVVEANPQPNTLDEDLTRLSEIRYWQVSTISGTYNGSMVKLSVGSDEGFEDLIGTVVAEGPATGGNFVSLGQAETTGDATEGTVTSAAIATQKILALGITSRFSLEKTILVPSAFAPYGIKPEDQQLVIFGNNVTARDFSFKIFNRWGKLVFQTDSYDEATTTGWNGENETTHEMEQFGVYSYILQARFEDGTIEKKAGTITLFR